MATGDILDIAARFRRLLPRGWFGDNAPVVDAVAQGVGAQVAPIYSMQEVAYAAMRLATCQGAFLDLFAADYFGSAGLPRLPGEGDAAYRRRIKWNLTAPRGTRIGMIGMLQSLTGRAPFVVNPGRPSDTGAYGIMRGYNTVGFYGSLDTPYQAFVTAFRGSPTITGTGAGDYATLPLPAGGYYPGGYGVGAIAYEGSNAVTGAMMDAHIYEQIANWTPVHSVSWVKLKD